MDALLTAAHAVDLALGVLLVELLLVALRGGRARAARLAAALAGMALLLAVRAALAGGGGTVVALVALGGIAHLAEQLLGRKIR